MKASLRLYAFLPVSHANGPGARAVVWVQGCSLGCAGCYNPETHGFAGGESVSVDDLFERVAALRDRIEGITISGGEPLQQSRALLRLLRRVREETDLSILIFTGYSWEEARQMKDAGELLACADVLIAGRYDESQRVAQSLIGSQNKTVHFLTRRYTMADLEAVPQAEVIITPEGDVIVSGIEPLRL